jgi:secreted PhoX family phosphatase
VRRRHPNNDSGTASTTGPTTTACPTAASGSASLNDLDAEWTGGFFDSTGKHFYVSVQHNSSGFGTILDITGWK